MSGDSLNDNKFPYPGFVYGTPQETEYWKHRLQQAERERDDFQRAIRQFNQRMAEVLEERDEYRKSAVMRLDIIRERERERDEALADAKDEHHAAEVLRAEVERLRAELEAWRIGQRKVELVVDLGEVGK
jgi:F0F1-type ATP synthase membrane subunit b/b'